ncbi:MAG: UDP-N-acetylmuramoyl-L-alanyl-D-glutamate--2,6-diaminopimelate ligase [Galactobacter sp.]
MSDNESGTDPHAQVGELERGFRPTTPLKIALDEVARAAGASDPSALVPDVVVSGVCLDSRAVQAGDLYAALPGGHTHGARFAAQAQQRGAVAVLTDTEGAGLMGDLADLPVIVVEDPRSVLGSVSQTVYNSAELAPTTYAVTGTNGKTTTTYMLRHLLSSAGETTGLIGTIEILAGDTAIPSVLTTPESPQLHGLMSRMGQAGVTTAAMEVSSHSLSFQRVAGLHFAVSGFTNLTQDHLDLHGSMEEYLAAKAELFTPRYSRAAVVTVDDEWGQSLARTSRGVGVPTATLSTGHGAGGAAGSADYVVTDVVRQGLGTAFVLLGPDELRIEARTGLPGSFNVSNAALALSMLLVGGMDPDALSQLLNADPEALTPQVPGRMQVVHHRPTAVVDFAHNPDALVRALDSLEVSGGRRIVVFGATGERDTTKRPIMGALAAQHADVVIVTDDDPHDEDPARIRAQVAAGARDAGAEATVLEVAPRARAIREAVALADPDDVILVAGRGHEVFQEVAGVNLSLDDREELAKAFAAESGERGSAAADGVGSTQS